MPVKLPRWVISSLIAANVLACVATASWWVTWPGRTAQEFRTLLRERRFRELDELITVDGRWVTLLLEDSDLRPEPRTLSDFLCGRRRYRDVEFHTYGPIVEISVQCGLVICCRKWPTHSGQLFYPGFNDNRLASRLVHPGGWVRNTVASIPEDCALVDRIFLQILARHPSEEEWRLAEQHLAVASNRNNGAEDLAWALLQSKEFRFRGARFTDRGDEAT